MKSLFLARSVMMRGNMMSGLRISSPVSESDRQVVKVLENMHGIQEKTLGENIPSEPIQRDAREQPPLRNASHKVSATKFKWVYCFSCTLVQQPSKRRHSSHSWSL